MMEGEQKQLEIIYPNRDCLLTDSKLLIQTEDLTSVLLVQLPKLKFDSGHLPFYVIISCIQTFLLQVEDILLSLKPEPKWFCFFFMFCTAGSKLLPEPLHSNSSWIFQVIYLSNKTQ